AMSRVISATGGRGLPFFAITVLAGLMAVPREYQEAAEVDGAGSWSRFWHVTLPLIKPVLAVVILFSTIFTFGDFNIVQVATRGGPITRSGPTPSGAAAARRAASGSAPARGRCSSYTARS